MNRGARAAGRGLHAERETGRGRVKPARPHALAGCAFDILPGLEDSVGKSPFRMLCHSYAPKRHNRYWRGKRGGMSLEPRPDDGVPEMTARMVRAAFPKGTLAIRIREALGPVFGDEDFASAFPVSGRPAASPGVLALVSVLQHAEKLSDREAADHVRARMDWKFLLGLELDDPGFDHTVLGDFRERLICHGIEEKVLDTVLERLSAAGLLRAGGRQRTDSTHVLASVRTLNRMEFVGETLRAALEALAAAAPAWLSGVIGPD